jgi:hypothetical protein
MRIPAQLRSHPTAGARAPAAVAAATLALALAGCGSGGSSSAPAARHFESGPQVERITRDLEVIDQACRVAAGPAALRAARDLGALIEAGPDDTYGPANARQTLAQLGRIAARKASCAHTTELRQTLRGLGSG